jgi:hypothetical protein
MNEEPIDGNTTILLQWQFRYLTGHPEVQIFDRRVGPVIVKILDGHKAVPTIWGTYKLEGEGSDALVCKVWASGYPGQR